MGLCLECNQKWTVKRRYSQRVIHRNVRDRLKEGESAAHFVSCLVHAFESEEFDDDEHLAEAEYAAQENFEEFGSYYAGKQENFRKNAEKTDMAITTQHISRAVKPL